MSGNSGSRTLPGGLSEHRAQSAAAFAALAGPDKAAGVVLDAEYKPESNIKFKAARIFRRIVAEAPKGHFLAVDVPLLVEYCVMIEKLELDHDTFLKAKATITGGKNGVVKVNPVITNYLKMQQRAASLSQMLRLQPLMRKTRSAFGESSKRSASVEPDTEESTPSGSRAGLMFGGSRVASALGAQDND